MVRPISQVGIEPTRMCEGGWWNLTRPQATLLREPRRWSSSSWERTEGGLRPPWSWGRRSLDFSLEFVVGPFRSLELVDDFVDEGGETNRVGRDLGETCLALGGSGQLHESLVAEDFL